MLKGKECKQQFFIFIAYSLVIGVIDRIKFCSNILWMKCLMHVSFLLITWVRRTEYQNYIIREGK